jgi:FtsZ-binding cell division protein ZapB
MADVVQILEALEKRVKSAIEKIATLLGQVDKLEQENKELNVAVAEQKLRIEGLQKQIEELSDRPPNFEVDKYKENEKLLKQRIRALLTKLDELKVLD